MLVYEQSQTGQTGQSLWRQLQQDFATWGWGISAQESCLHLRMSCSATVGVGGTLCTDATFVSATSITCVAPAKPAGSYAVVVIKPDTGYDAATTVVVTVSVFKLFA
eukprot:gene23591-9119_t